MVDGCWNDANRAALARTVGRAWAIAEKYAHWVKQLTWTSNVSSTFRLVGSARIQTKAVSARLECILWRVS
eukprot:64058-Prymnesium_polylepis.1